MADTLVDRLTGRAAASTVSTVSPRPVTWAEADTTTDGSIGGNSNSNSNSNSKAQSTTIEVNLVMTDTALLGAGDEPAHLPGFGPVPAPLARTWITDPTAQVFIRRLYTRPTDSTLVALDSRARLFPDGLRRLITLRDDLCRTPWCEAPIRHLDHIQQAADGGPTSPANGQGLCERCNHAKQAPDWVSAATDSAVQTSTPTGWTYTTTVPPPTTGPARSPAGPDDLPPPPDVPPEPPGWLGPDGLADFMLTA